MLSHISAGTCKWHARCTDDTVIESRKVFYTLPDESYLVSRTVFRWILVDWSVDHLFPTYTKEKVQALNQWFDY